MTHSVMWFCCAYTERESAFVYLSRVWFSQSVAKLEAQLVSQVLYKEVVVSTVVVFVRVSRSCRSIRHRLMSPYSICKKCVRMSHSVCGLPNSDTSNIISIHEVDQQNHEILRMQSEIFLAQLFAIFSV